MPRPRGYFSAKPPHHRQARCGGPARPGLEIVDDIRRQHDIVPAVAGHDAVRQFVEFSARPLAAGLPQVAAVGCGRRDGARPELELLRDGRDRLVNLRRVRPQRIVPELHAIFGIEWIEPERRHGEWKLVTNLGDGDDKSIKLGKTFLKETFSLRLVDIDEEREAAERRFPSQHGQQDRVPPQACGA